MKSAVCVLASALLLVVAAQTMAEDAVLTRSEVDRLKKTWEPGMIGTDTLEKAIKISPDTNAKIKFSITSKGNGVISLPGMDVWIYDGNLSHYYYKGDLLNNMLVDLDKDGFRDIVLWGVAVLTDEDSDEVKGEVAIVSVFHYNPTAGKFENTLPSDHVAAETR